MKVARKFESYVKNSFIVSRSNVDEPIFMNTDQGVFASLDGYAVVPLEEYEKHIDNVRALLARREEK